MRQTGIVLDFVGQDNQLIARRVREQHVYCEMLPYSADISRIRDKHPIGIIFTGGPNSVYDAGAPTIDPAIYELGVPILGICYGSQLIAMQTGGEVSRAKSGEYGKAEITYQKDNALFGDIGEANVCWMSHMDYISKVADRFDVLASTKTCPIAAFGDAQKKL